MTFDQIKKGHYQPVYSRFLHLTAKGGRHGELSDAELEEFKALKDRMDELDKRDGVPPEILTAGREGGAQGFSGRASNHFNSVGQFLQMCAAAVRPADMGPVANYPAGQMAKPLADFMAAASGASVGVPSDGGFLTGSEMSNELLERVYETGILARRCRRRDLSGPASSLKLNAFDETSRADGSRFGGVRAYWKSEAEALSGSKPKFRQIELEPKKLSGLYYATDELLQDATALEQEVRDAFADEFGFKLDDAILNGTGVGQPLGILNSGALVEISAEGGQSADTIVWENCLGMFQQFNGREASAYWVGHKSIVKQLGTMSVAVGTGGGGPVLQPQSDGTKAPPRQILGYPLQFAEQAQAIGDKGDLGLYDFSQYVISQKGGIQGAVSIHVKFIEDEVVFRWILRIDGQPRPASPVTAFKGAAQESPFVVIEAR